MPEYHYRARDVAGKMIRGDLMAINEAELEERLQQQGLFLISASSSAHDVSQLSRSPLSGKRSSKRVTLKELLGFTVNLQALYAAGVPLLQGIEDILSETDSRAMRYVLGDVTEHIREGEALSQAFSHHPKVFPKLYINLINSGEQTGKLDQVLVDLIHYLEWQIEIRGQVKQATIYPSIVLLAVVGLILILVGYVFPKFFVLFQNMSIELPLATKIVYGTSQIIKKYILVIVAFLLFTPVIYRLLYKTDSGARFFDGLKFKIPFIGTLMHKIAVSRFAHNMSILINSGVDIQRALELIEGVVGNRILSDAVKRSKAAINDGSSIADALRATSIFPPLLIRMVTIGERSGQLDAMMQKIASFYDREIPQTIKKIFTIMEPVVLILLGGVVAFVAFSIFLPLYKIQSSIR